MLLTTSIATVTGPTATARARLTSYGAFSCHIDHLLDCSSFSSALLLLIYIIKQRKVYHLKLWQCSTKRLIIEDIVYLILVELNNSIRVYSKICSNKSVDNIAASLREDVGGTRISCFTGVAVRLRGCKPGWLSLIKLWRNELPYVQTLHDQI